MIEHLAPKRERGRVSAIPSFASGHGLSRVIETWRLNFSPRRPVRTLSEAERGSSQRKCICVCRSVALHSGLWQRGGNIRVPCRHD